MGIRGRETVTVSRKTVKVVAGKNVEDSYGNPEYTNANTTITGCLISQGAATVDVDLTGYEYEQIITILAPGGADLRANDTISWGGKTWQPLGEPVQWTTQYGSPNAPRKMLVCKAVEEGYL